MKAMRRRLQSQKDPRSECKETTFIILVCLRCGQFRNGDNRHLSNGRDTRWSPRIRGDINRGLLLDCSVGAMAWIG